MFELRKQFRFDAAHTLEREIDIEPSRRIHGHSYRCEVTVRGTPDPVTGMVIDLGFFERELQVLHEALDHRLLDEVADLGPATLENLCLWIWRRLQPKMNTLWMVSVFRDSSGDACFYRGE